MKEQEFQDLIASYNKEGKKVSLTSLNANGINPRTIMKDFAKVNDIYDMAKAVSFLIKDSDYCLFWLHYQNAISKINKWVIYEPIGLSDMELIVLDLIINYYYYLIDMGNYKTQEE